MKRIKSFTQFINESKKKITFKKGDKVIISKPQRSRDTKRFKDKVGVVIRDPSDDYVYVNLKKFSSPEIEFHISELELVESTNESFAQFVNERIEDGQVICDSCSWEWDIVTGGDDPYTCHKCGADNHPMNEESTEVTEARGFTLKEIRRKALDVLHSIGIKSPSEKQIAEIIDNLRSFITKEKVGVIFESKGYEGDVDSPEDIIDLIYALPDSIHSLKVPFDIKGKSMLDLTPSKDKDWKEKAAAVIKDIVGKEGNRLKFKLKSHFGRGGDNEPYYLIIIK